MPVFTLLRHGETQWNKDDRMQGQTDIPLTSDGQNQAGRLAQYWVNQGVRFDCIISSPLARAWQTAEIIAGTQNLPVSTNPLWIERAFGELEGRSFIQVRQEMPQLDFFHPTVAPAEGAESLNDLFTRAERAVASLTGLPDGKTLVVSHGALLNMALYAILGLRPEQNGFRTRFRFENLTYVEISFTPTEQTWRIRQFTNPLNGANVKYES